MAIELAMVDDELMPLADAKISAHDRSIYFGDGVYEAIRYCNGRLFAKDRHLQRLENSLRKMDMLEKVDLKLINQRVNRAIAESEISAAMVYFHITRGQALRSHDYGLDWQPGFLLTIRHFKSHNQPTTRAITHPDWRWKRCDIKSLNLLANIMAKHTATQAGVHDAILVDDKGLVTESTSSSVLMVKGNCLQTAPLTANILPGITRSLLLQWAPELGLQVLEQSFTPEEIFQADELMITGTGTEVMTITHLDDNIIGTGQAGKYSDKFRLLLIEAMYGK